MARIASGASHRQVADELGIHERTISKWMHIHTFEAALRVARIRLRQRIESRAFAAAEDGYVVLQRMIRSNNPKERADGAKAAVASAVRLAARYKELRVEEYIPPPMFLIPDNAVMRIKPVEPVAPPKIAIPVTTGPREPDEIIQPGQLAGPIVDVEATEPKE